MSFQFLFSAPVVQKVDNVKTSIKRITLLNWFPRYLCDLWHDGGGGSGDADGHDDYDEPPNWLSFIIRFPHF